MIIQVVDDEFDLVNLIKLYLREIGLNAVGFTDSSLAFEHFRINSKYCMLVISDIRMPDMNGFEFVRKAKEINSTVKVFLMTCFETDDLELSLLSINSSSSSPLTTKLIVDEFIRKPFSIENLIMLINKHNIMKNRTKGPIVPPMALL